MTGSRRPGPGRVAPSTSSPSSPALSYAGRSRPGRHRVAGSWPISSSVPAPSPPILSALTKRPRFLALLPCKVRAPLRSPLSASPPRPRPRQLKPRQLGRRWRGLARPTRRPGGERRLPWGRPSRTWMIGGRRLGRAGVPRGQGRIPHLGRRFLGGQGRRQESARTPRPQSVQLPSAPDRRRHPRHGQHRHGQHRHGQHRHGQHRHGQHRHGRPDRRPPSLKHPERWLTPARRRRGRPEPGPQAQRGGGQAPERGRA